MNRPSYFLLGMAATAMMFVACTSDPNAPGVEYMPDMYRSPAPEAYVDYGANKHVDWTQAQKDAAGIKPVLVREPVAGTIPYTGGSAAAMFVMPYALANTPEDYERAAVEVKSPILPMKDHVERGKEIYAIMCTHCHGKEGHGDGAISKNGHINGIPDYATKLKDLPEGKMFHSITYGKGLMGQHASQLNQLERWQVVQYVKCLQQGVSNPEFDEKGMLKLKATEAPADSTKQ